MQERIIISMGNSILTIDNDNYSKLVEFGNFCKSCGARSYADDPYELTIDSPTESIINEIYSLAFELGLI